MPAVIPAVFFGHGNPMNALERNPYSEGWAAVGRAIPKPRAVLSISAHWYTPGTGVTISTSPRTIHDFGGFPPELYQVQYPAPGDPQLAQRVAQLLAPVDVSFDSTWGLDHGTWSVLCHVYPSAEVPVVQLSIDHRQPPQFHYELGRRLAPLREEGVLIAGSGNIVHNLRAYFQGLGRPEPYDWGARFDAHVRELILASDHRALVDYHALGSDARLAIPTPDHYLPLLYILGAAGAAESATFPVEGLDGGGAISMLAVQIGPRQP